MAASPDPTQSWSQRIWRSLSIANVWACGVATAEHAWAPALAAVFFAVTAWGLSDVRVMAFFDSESDDV